MSINSGLISLNKLISHISAFANKLGTNLKNKNRGGANCSAK
jgi:hypothetical protein